MVTHRLPFDAEFRPDLMAHIRRQYDIVRGDAPERITAIIWARIHPYSGPDRKCWLVGGFGREDMRPEEIFVVDGMPVYISSQDQERMRGRTLDVIMGEGVVDVTPTI
jgi:hypothetical protein